LKTDDVLKRENDINQMYKSVKTWFILSKLCINTGGDVLYVLDEGVIQESTCKYMHFAA